MRGISRVLVWAAIVALAIVVAGGAWLYWRNQASLPQLDGAARLPGLQAPVEVFRDARGVPHLRARSLEDLLFAQGYVTAQDRLWQMDLSRRLAMGELSEIFGESMLKFDIENRTLGFHRVAARAVAELDEDSRKLLAAYSRGVNAFISTHAGRLPVEFLALGYEPRPWREADSISIALNMAKTLSTTWPDELMRERIRSKVPPELYADLFPDRSDLDHPVAEPLAARAPAGEPSAASCVSSPEHPAAALSEFLAPAIDASLGLGSNNWVLTGAHTQSGKPLLANDPHLPHGIPSLWYMLHLKAPGLNVSGVSLPGLPLVIIGHNERIAWGMTNTAADVQDLYVESFNFRDPDKYLDQGQWVDAEVRGEVIQVRHKRDYWFTVKVTRHGPVISHDGDRDLALRWVALDPHSLRLPFLKIDQSQNWQEFTTALRDFTGPTQNFVYADADGNIGYYAAGWIPIRKQGDGTVPSIGSTSDHDWTGYIPFDDLPHAYNPPGGILATANGRVVPDGYPYLITRKWDAAYRTSRIYQLLEAGNHFTVADMLRIQTDILALDNLWLAKQLLAADDARPTDSADARYALTLLRGWDGEARADSAPTLVCELTRQALLERLLKPKLGDDFSGYKWPMSATFLENVLKNKWPRWLPPGDADFHVTLVKSLEESVGRIPELVGSANRDAWQWGKTIPLTFHHRLSLGLRLAGRFLDVGPFPQAGTAHTVKQTTPTLGPSMRMVVEFSDFDNSLQNITLGESGQFSSPYYRDQFDAWSKGTSFPMLFSDQAVEKSAAHKLVLEP